MKESDLLASLTKGQVLYSQNCTKCHGEIGATNIRSGDAETINLNLNTNPTMQSLRKSLSAADVNSISLALVKAPANLICGPTYPAGRTTIQRLTNEEYNNTVRDLLFTSTRAADKFPPANPGSSGFVNDAEGLSVYEELMTNYYDAAESLAAEVIASKSVANGPYQMIAGCAQTAGVNLQNCAIATVQKLATRAFRRPVTGAEQTRLMQVFNQSNNFDIGLSDVITSILINPKFLFISIVSSQSRLAASEFALDDYELAARLSYFLWQTMPDDELINLAGQNKLHLPDVLKAQVVRMLKNPKNAALTKVLTNEYAGLQSMATNSSTTISDSLRLSMVKETELFIDDMVRNDLSITNLINGEYSFVNQELASFYGIPFTGPSANTFVKVPSASSGRLGIGSQASILTATSGGPIYTHPVKRGLWVARKVLCDEPPPPPPNLPMIDFETAVGGTIRDKMAAHTSNASCIGCHKVMDNVGLGLENYDSFGRWRQKYAPSNLAINSSGVLPDGTAFANSQEMYKKLGVNPQVRSCLPRHILNLALTRKANSAGDKCVAQVLGTANAQSTSKLSDLIYGVVMTNQFLKQTGEAP